MGAAFLDFTLGCGTFERFLGIVMQLKLKRKAITDPIKEGIILYLVFFIKNYYPLF